MEYLADVGINILIFIGLAVSLNLLMGYAGQFSMAHATFYGIGAYTAGILAIRYGWITVPAVIAAMVIAFACASFVSLPASRRVKGEYFILLTLAFQQVFTQLLNSLPTITGGPYGLSPIPPIELFGTVLANPSQFFPVLLVVTVVIVAATWGLGESPFGRLLKGIREDEPVVKALGKNTTAHKLVIFGLSSLIAGLVGAISAYYYQFIAPSTYSLDTSIFIVAIVVLGGLGNLTGSITAAVVLGSIRPILQHMSFIGLEKSFYWQGLLYGLALVVLLVFRPQGILPEGASVGALFRRLRGRPLARSDPQESGPPVKALVPHIARPQVVVALAAAGSDGLASEQTLTREGLGRQQELETTVGRSAEGAMPGRICEAPAGAVQNGEILRTVDLVKQFGGIHAIDHVSLAFQQHHITALIGPNGAGKTTVFNLITGTIKPDHGQVLLRDMDITGKSPNQVANLGMVRLFQDVRLFDRLSALDNIAMAVPGQPGENPAILAVRPIHIRKSEAKNLTKARDYLDIVGMRHKAAERVGDLSYAEQKLVAIARLLATGAEILLLDEPTSGIDPSSLDKMINLVRGLPALGRTICIVEHNLHVVEQLADHVVFMEEGRVTAEGMICELRKEAHLAEVYFGG